MGRLIAIDCIEAMKAMEPESVDAVVCDPPAGISFMGKEWDRDKGGREWKYDCENCQWAFTCNPLWGLCSSLVVEGDPPAERKAEVDRAIRMWKRRSREYHDYEMR